MVPKTAWQICSTIKDVLKKTHMYKMTFCLVFSTVFQKGACTFHLHSTSNYFLGSTGNVFVVFLFINLFFSLMFFLLKADFSKSIGFLLEYKTFLSSFVKYSFCNGSDLAGLPMNFVHKSRTSTKQFMHTVWDLL